MERGRPVEESSHFLLKNPDFLLKTPDFPLKNPDFPLKNVDHMNIKTGGLERAAVPHGVATDGRRLNDLQAVRVDAV